MNIYDFIGTIVAQLRLSGSITAASVGGDPSLLVVSTNYVESTICSVFDLAVGDYIDIDNNSNFSGEHKIIAIDPVAKTFTIKITEAPIATDLGTYTKQAPYYSYEKWLPEANRINYQQVGQRFPHIFFRLNVQHSSKQSLYENYDSVSLFFLYGTDVAQLAEWRVDNVFEPVLYPISNAFLNKFEKSSSITQPDNFEYNFSDLFFLGSEDANQNKLHQIVDARELQINNFTLRNRGNTCDCNVKIYKNS